MALQLWWKLVRSISLAQFQDKNNVIIIFGEKRGLTDKECEPVGPTDDLKTDRGEGPIKASALIVKIKS
jgi:hypothetical protein